MARLSARILAHRSTGQGSFHDPDRPAVRGVRKLKLSFERLVDVTAVSNSEADLRLALDEQTRASGFNHYAYLHLRPQWAYAVSNYSSEWRQRYFEADYAKIDPVVTIARATQRAFDWCGKTSSQLPSREVRLFYSEAADFGIRSGITIPVRTAFGHMSMLTLASDKPEVDVAAEVDQVEAVTAIGYLHAKFEQFNTSPIARGNLELTPKQASCLRWSAEGKSMKDIAVLEKTSFGNVNFHLNNARKALNAASLAQATAIASRLRLI